MRCTHVAAVGVLVLAIGCESDPTMFEDLVLDAPLIHTDAAEYVAVHIAGSGPAASYAFTVIATLENGTPRNLYLARCSPGIERPIWSVDLVNGDDPSGSGYSPAWGCTGNEPFRMRPGESRTDTLRLSGPTSYDGVTGASFGALEGTMRLGYDIRLSAHGDPPNTPRLMRTSNTFEVSLAPSP